MHNLVDVTLKGLQAADPIASEGTPMGAIRLGSWSTNGTPLLALESDDMQFSTKPANNTVVGRRTTLAFDAIAAYIPAEALGFYVIAVSFIGRLNWNQDLLISLATIAITLLLLSAAYIDIPKGRRDRRKFGVSVCLSLAASVVYLSAMPDSLAHDWRPYTHLTSGLVVIFCAVFLPVVGKILKLTPEG